MKSKVVSGIMLTLLLIGMLILTFNIQPVKSEPTTIIVPDNYAKIRWAIGNASDGDTIFVRAGTYYEQVTIDKNNLAIIGENAFTTIIDGVGGETVVNVAANDVNLSGFTIRNGGYGIRIVYFGGAAIQENYIMGNNFIGIYLYFSHNNVIVRNNVTGNGYGVWLVHSGINTFENNNIFDNKWQALIVEGSNLWDFIQNMDTSNKVNGKPVYYWVNERNRKIPYDAGYIAAVNSTNITIRNLTVERSGQGVLLANTTNSVVEETTLTKNKYGIYLCCSRNITINKNTITSNGLGISLLLSHENNISSNVITKNEYGIDMGHSEGNNINGNAITDQKANDNSWGINLWGSKNNLIVKNNITNNKRGIELFKSENNLIHHNNFLNNAKQVYSYDSLINTWDDGYPSGGNHWSDHVCTGNPNDGSQPYVIDADNIDHYPFQDPDGWLRHQLTIASSLITGMPFTINGVPQTTPYTEWLLEGSYTLIMPETHNGYVWSHWLGDGDTNRTKTIVLADNTIWTGVFRLLADINGDGIVSINDVVIAALAFGSAAEDDPSTPWNETRNWNPDADLNNDGLINIIDLVIIGVNFGRRL